MDETEAWAISVRVADALLHGRLPIAPFEEARIAIQAVTRSVVLVGAPVERFSDKMPRRVSTSPEDEGFFPIDILYGCYDPENQTITIYINNIRRDAHVFGATEAELLEIVRLHEYAHAIVHVGVPFRSITEHLSALALDGYTDWRTFLEHRNRAFKAIDIASHEFLAQAITFTCFNVLPNVYRLEHLKSVFDALEKKQPAHYVLPTDLKTIAQDVDWTLIMETARDFDSFSEVGFSRCAGLLALARDFGRTRSTPDGMGAGH
jgi:hypothetical protein